MRKRCRTENGVVFGSSRTQIFKPSHLFVPFTFQAQRQHWIRAARQWTDLRPETAHVMSTDTSSSGFVDVPGSGTGTGGFDGTGAGPFAMGGPSVLGPQLQIDQHIYIFHVGGSVQSSSMDFP